MKLTAETRIAADRETVWRLSQTSALHVRWDLRFADIEPLANMQDDGALRFRYATRLGPGLTIEGWGATVANAEGMTSALRFGSADRRSLILEGSGSWTYREHDAGVVLSTVYDYRTRHGRAGCALDLVFRPLMVWATRWSFDRLRIWIEDGLRPELAFRLWILKVAVRCALALTWIYEGLVPKILAQRADEIALVQNSALYWTTPSHTLAALGAAEIAFGLWLLSGRAERTAAVLSTIGICSLAALVVWIRPEALADPFGGISKNLGLLACGLVIWTLSGPSPLARRARPEPRRAPGGPPQTPFAQALGDTLKSAAPLVRAHLNAPVGTHRYEGVMRRVWRVHGLRRWLTAPFLRVGCWMRALFPETGEHVPFTMVNRVFVGPDGALRMTFERTFRFAGRERLFHATIRYDSARGAIVDDLGQQRHLLVELVPAIVDGGVILQSGRQWFTPFGFPLRIPLPRFLAGEATLREWQDSRSSLGISVTISNRLFGPFFGYEGTFRAVEEPDGAAVPPPPRPSAAPLSRRSRAALATIAVAGTAAYAASFAAASVAHAAEEWAVRIGTAAALSWPVFGLALVTAHGSQSASRWADVCLRTMTRGIAVLSLATIMNLFLAAGSASLSFAWFAAGHAAISWRRISP